MHIVLALLGSIVTILVLLDRLGVDIGWLNPFHWGHRRRWANKFEGDPIYAIEEPLHVAALLIMGVARLDGEISAEQKQTAQEQFEAVFKLESKEASELMTSASHLLGGPQILENQIDGLIGRNEGTFSPEQAQSMMEMMVKVASADGALSATQQDFIDKIRSKCVQAPKGDGTWA